MILQNNLASTGRLIAKIHQTGTDAPTIIPLIDTIEGITIQRAAAGQYTIISPTAKFTTERTVINGMFDDSSGYVPTLLSLASLNDNFVQYSWQSTSLITMDVKNAAGIRVELSSLGNINLPLTIEVFNHKQIL